MSTEPAVITLSKDSSLEILIKYIHLIQDKGGVFELKEADVLRRAIDVLINGKKDDAEIDNNIKAINLLIQGVLKAQKVGGVLTLNDASLLYTTIEYIRANADAITATVPVAAPTPIVSNTGLLPVASPTPPTAAPSIAPQPGIKAPTPAPAPSKPVPVAAVDQELFSLSEPVPLRPREI